MKNEIDIPEGIQAKIEGNKITISKEGKELTRLYPTRLINIKLENNALDVTGFSDIAKSRAIVGTIKSHIRNMIQGLQEPFVYKLKVCSVHFPMSVKQSGNEITIQNFLGEKKHRKVKVTTDSEIRIEGQDITVSSHDKEAAGLVASRLEQATRLRKKDRRIFQDGIFITEKAGKAI